MKMKRDMKLNSILSCRYLRSLVLLAVMMVGGATGA